MRPRTSFAVALGVFYGMAAMAQGAPTQGPGVQAAHDAREPQVLATECKTPPPQPPSGNGGFRVNKPPPNYHVTAIQGIVASDARWRVIWHTSGDNADGIVGTTDGGILIAQNDKSDVVKLMADGHASIVYRDTDTGGALSEDKQGQLFIVERGLRASIWELSPLHKVIANRYEGGPFDCIGGDLSDLSATANGGAYFIQGGQVFHAAPDGSVSHYAPDLLRGNGIILSPDETKLYVTNAGTLVAFNVQPDGALANERKFATLPGGGGDGSTVDAQGNVYVSGAAAVRVISPQGAVLGVIPAPIQLTSLAFSGSDKKTLFAVGMLRRNKPGIAGIAGMEVLVIPMIAQGYTGRAK